MASRKDVCCVCGVERIDPPVPMDLLDGCPACHKCIDERVRSSKYWFRSHVPGCCDGVPRRHVTFHTKAACLDYLKSHVTPGYELCKDGMLSANIHMDGSGYVMECRRGTGEWYVVGFTNVDLTAETWIPDYRDICDTGEAK